MPLHSRTTFVLSSRFPFLASLILCAMRCRIPLEAIRKNHHDLFSFSLLNSLFVTPTFLPLGSSAQNAFCTKPTCAHLRPQRLGIPVVSTNVLPHVFLATELRFQPCGAQTNSLSLLVLSSFPTSHTFVSSAKVRAELHPVLGALATGHALAAAIWLPSASVPSLAHSSVCSFPSMVNEWLLFVVASLFCAIRFSVLFSQVPFCRRTCFKQLPHRKSQVCTSVPWCKIQPFSTVHRQCPSYPCEWSLAQADTTKPW